MMSRSRHNAGVSRSSFVEPREGWVMPASLVPARRLAQWYVPRSAADTDAAPTIRGGDLGRRKTRGPFVPVTFFFSSRRRHTSSVSAFLLNRSSDLEKYQPRQKQHQ